MSTPRYSVGLTSKVLTRARKILGFLLLLLVVLIVAGIHQGVVSKDFDKIFIQPFRQFAVDLEKAAEPTATLTPLSTPLPIQTAVPLKQVVPTPKPAVKQQTQPVVANCIRKNIREGEFASNKCYSQQDYEDLQYYLGRYSDAKFDLSSAEGFLKIDCGAAQTFEVKKADCEKDKQDKSAAEAEITKYINIIQGIIAKGR